MQNFKDQNKEYLCEYLGYNPDEVDDITIEPTLAADGTILGYSICVKPIKSLDSLDINMTIRPTSELEE